MSTVIYNTQKVFPYVYYGIHHQTDEFYIGFRKANVVPSTLDLGVYYKTSSKEVSKRGFENCTWIVIAEFFTWEAAYNFEQQLIIENFYNQLCLNKYHRKSNKFSFCGKSHSEEAKQKNEY